MLKQFSIPAQGWNAELQIMLWPNSPELLLKKRPMIVICPGGGYQMVSDREAEPISAAFFAMGYHTAILRYSVAPARHPVPLLQLAGAVKLIREHSEEWLVEEDKLLVTGFSAGGHLACSLGVFWNKPFLREHFQCDSRLFQPNGLILSYPVITSGKFAHQGSFEHLLGKDAGSDSLRRELSLEYQVNEDMPPVFLWHTYEDGSVPVENSLLLSAALHRHGVPQECHFYQKGCHGLSLANRLTQDAQGGAVQKECQSWIALAHTWIESNFGI